jgi:hypothetical protein
MTAIQSPVRSLARGQVIDCDNRSDARRRHFMVRVTTVRIGRRGAVSSARLVAFANLRLRRFT